MTTKDRDNYFALMVFYDKVTTWRDDAESEITPKDRTKLKIIADTILAMLVQYRKKEGETALNSILQESSKYKFAIITQEENTEFTNTFEPHIIKPAMKKVADKCKDCVFCKRANYTKCEWYTLHKFMETPQCNFNKKQCPFRVNEDFMDF